MPAEAWVKGYVKQEEPGERDTRNAGKGHRERGVQSKGNAEKWYREEAWTVHGEKGKQCWGSMEKGCTVLGEAQGKGCAETGVCAERASGKMPKEKETYSAGQVEGKGRGAQGRGTGKGQTVQGEHMERDAQRRGSMGKGHMKQWDCC